MLKAEAKIRKEGSKWCVVSEDGTRKFGCYPTRKQAVNRLGQIEHFKKEKAMTGTIAGIKSEHVTDSREHYPINDENQARSAVVRVTNLDSQPEWFNGPLDRLKTLVYTSVAVKYPDMRVNFGVPINEVHAIAQSLDAKTKTKDKGTAVFPATSKRVRDNKDHFPINDINQARNALSRVAQFNASPSWYTGSLEELQSTVYNTVSKKFPSIQAEVDPRQEQMAKEDVKDPNANNKSNVPDAKTPTLDNTGNRTVKDMYASLDENARQSIANQLLERIKKQEELLAERKKLAQKIVKKGITSEEFAVLHDYLQEEIVHNLHHQNIHASAIQKMAKDRIKNG
jgi:hypothetical protein